jgi:Flp pilus assembly protein TadG
MKTIRKGIRRTACPRARLRGQSMVIIIIALPIMVGGMALSLDVGNLYLTRAKLQNAGDVSALAGDNYLPHYQSQAVSTAQSYAQKNGVQLNEIQSITVSSDNKSLTVTIARAVPCYFCAVLGVTNAYAATNWPGGTGSVNVSSSATLVSTTSTTGAVPLAVDYRTDRSYGSQVVLKQGQVGAGNWDPLALGDPGGDTYRQNVDYGYPGTVSVGNSLTTETGNLVGPTQQAVSDRLNRGLAEYPNGTFDNHALDDPRVVVVPMVDFSNINGNSQVPCKGFAVMWLVSLQGNANLTCHFIEQAVSGVGSPTQADYGSATPVLTK